LIMRLLVGAGTPRESFAGASAHLLLFVTAEEPTGIVLIIAAGTEAAFIVVSFEPGRLG